MEHEQTKIREDLSFCLGQGYAAQCRVLFWAVKIPIQEREWIIWAKVTQPSTTGY